MQRENELASINQTSYIGNTGKNRAVIFGKEHDVSSIREIWYVGRNKPFI